MFFSMVWSSWNCSQMKNKGGVSKGCWHTAFAFTSMKYDYFLMPNSLMIARYLSISTLIK